MKVIPTRRVSRQTTTNGNPSHGFDADFDVEHYLHHQASSFLERFDANSYLYLSRVMDHYDPFADPTAAREQLRDCRTRFLVVSFDSDWRFNTADALLIANTLASAGHTVEQRELHSPHGHDSFLLPIPAYHAAIREFLAAAGQTRPHTEPLGRAD